MVVLSEVIKQHDLWAYPYNALRNQAVSRAKTEVRMVSGRCLADSGEVSAGPAASGGRRSLSCHTALEAQQSMPERHVRAQVTRLLARDGPS